MVLFYTCSTHTWLYVCVCIEGGGGGCTGGKLSVREIPLSVCHSYLHVLHDGCAANNMQAADQATIKEREKKDKMRAGGGGHAVVDSVCG